MLKNDWLAAAEDEIYPRLYPAGTVLTGELLERARGLGLLAEDAPENSGKQAPDGKPKPSAKAHAKAPETK